METYGKLNIAFNNAGVEGRGGPTTDETVENYNYVMDINVQGVWLSMKYQLPEMLKAGGGSIVNNASVAGLVGVAGAGIYAASKHAVMGLTKCAALELATAVLWLCSDKAAFVTGTSLSVDGGITAQ